MPTKREMRDLIEAAHIDAQRAFVRLADLEVKNTWLHPVTDLLDSVCRGLEQAMGQHHGTEEPDVPAAA